jgi:hypothetical protein
MIGSASETDVQARSERRNLYAGVRGAAVRLLNRVERSDSYLDRVLDAELRDPELSDLDKGLLTELVHGVLRWQNKLDWVLNGFSHGNFQKSEVNIACRPLPDPFPGPDSTCCCGERSRGAYQADSR